MLTLSGSQCEFLYEFLRDWLARRKGDTCLGSLQPGGSDVCGMRLDSRRRNVEAALLTERCIARNDGFFIPEPWHVVGDNFLYIWQCKRELRAQVHQKRSEVIGGSSNIGVVVSKVHVFNIPAWRDRIKRNLWSNRLGRHTFVVAQPKATA